MRMCGGLSSPDHLGALRQRALASCYHCGRGNCMEAEATAAAQAGNAAALKLPQTAVAAAEQLSLPSQETTKLECPAGHLLGIARGCSLGH